MSESNAIGEVFISKFRNLLTFMDELIEKYQINNISETSAEKWNLFKEQFEEDKQIEDALFTQLPLALQVSTINGFVGAVRDVHYSEEGLNSTMYKEKLLEMKNKLEKVLAVVDQVDQNFPEFMDDVKKLCGYVALFTTPFQSMLKKPEEPTYTSIFYLPE